MLAAWKQRFGGAGAPGSNVMADLKRATDSGVIEVPKELFTAVVQASNNTEEDRRTIMMHLRDCLTNTSCFKWRRIYAALLLLEELLQPGASPELLMETAEGRHFDLIQRLSLLEKFECTTDKRVQNMVRTKATSLRAEVVPRLESPESTNDKPKADSSPDNASVSTCSQSAANSNYTSFSSLSAEDAAAAPVPRRPQGQMILNGVVAVGHRDDTTSESSGDEKARRPVAYRAPTRKSAAERNGAAPRSPSPAKQQSFDLLDF